MVTPARIVVGGGSIAGVTAADALRSAGFDGTLTLVGQDWHATLSRPSLSEGCSRTGDHERLRRAGSRVLVDDGVRLVGSGREIAVLSSGGAAQQADIVVGVVVDGPTTARPAGPSFPVLLRDISDPVCGGAMPPGPVPARPTV